MSNSVLKAQITEDMKTAMRAKDTARLAAIRLMLAEIKQREVDSRESMSDAQILELLNKMIKQRRESYAQYAQASRDDLAQKEQAEIDVIEAYLPAQLSENEIKTHVAKAIAESDASGMQAIGSVMATLKAKLQGQADMSLVSRLVKEALSQ